MSKKTRKSKQSTSEVPISTYQTRLKNQPDAVLGALDDCASLLSRVERQLFAQSQKVDTFKGKVFNQIKSFFLSFFGILSRHFNSINFALQGKVDSYRSNLKRYINENQERIDKTRKTIEKLSKKEIESNQRQKHLNKIHQKKRRLARLEKRLEQLESDEATGRVRICFGSKKLFNAQFYLKANGYESIEQWKSDWQKARSNQFILVGSKDETAGNQLCTATRQKDGTLTLRVRMPDALVSKHGKYVEIYGVKFEYGQEVIEAALNDNEARRVLKKIKRESHKIYGQAITYRFRRDEKGWRVFVSTARPQIPIKTLKDIGTIGIDLNANHIALVETDRFGNAVETQTIPLNTYGKSKGQTEAIIGEAVKTIVEHSEKTLKPVVIEDLYFSQKRSILRENGSSRYARMLSSFVYSKFRSFLESRAYRHGVRLYKVNPAFTSVIGRVKYASRYGMTVHHAAALVIARRLCRFSERAPSGCQDEVLIPNNKGGHVTFPLPVRNRGKHVWSFWRRVSRKIKSVVYVTQVRAAVLTDRSSQTQGPLVGTEGPPSLEPCPVRSRHTNR
ncbi:MAG: IS200/IS605 family accessory protein TnpB-related protein [Pseudomonadota bacterium]